MKINVKILIEKEACEEIINYFIKTFGRNAEVNVYKVIEKCHEDKNNYSEWLYKKFQLTGEVVRYYWSGELQWRGNYKDGRLNGEWVEYYESGEVKVEQYWKDGKRIFCFDYSKQQNT